MIYTWVYFKFQTLVLSFHHTFKGSNIGWKKRWSRKCTNYFLVEQKTEKHVFQVWPHRYCIHNLLFVMFLSLCIPSIELQICTRIYFDRNIDCGGSWRFVCKNPIDPFEKHKMDDVVIVGCFWYRLNKYRFLNKK